MSSINISFSYDGTQQITVNEYTTDSAIRDVRWLISKGIIYPESVKKATIDYDFERANRDVKEMCPNDYPLRLEGKTITLLVGGVSAGYSGEGPHGLVEILKLMGFIVSPLTEERIYNTTKIILKKDYIG